MLEDQMNAHIKMLYQNILGWTEENLKTSVEITVRQGEISELPNVWIAWIGNIKNLYVTYTNIIIYT